MFSKELLSFLIIKLRTHNLKDWQRGWGFSSVVVGHLSGMPEALCPSVLKGSSSLGKLSPWVLFPLRCQHQLSFHMLLYSRDHPRLMWTATHTHPPGKQSVWGQEPRQGGNWTILSTKFTPWWLHIAGKLNDTSSNPGSTINSHCDIKILKSPYLWNGDDKTDNTIRTRKSCNNCEQLSLPMPSRGSSSPSTLTGAIVPLTSVCVFLPYYLLLSAPSPQAHSSFLYCSSLF